LIVRALLLASAALLAACASTPPAEIGVAEPAAAPAAPATAGPARHDPALAAMFEAYDRAELALSPMAKAYRGIRDQDYGRWDDYGEAAAQAERDLDLRTLAELRARFDRARLSPEDQLSYDIFVNMVERAELIFPFRNRPMCSTR
jgi:uncharacterized protein (DUF885 family)